jgi:hypothetical protein
LDEIPMPAAIAERPRDERGYPVLAITPWSDGKPDFAITSTARILVCAVERRCSICGTPLRKGPVWRVVAAEEAAAIVAVHANGGHASGAYVNAASTVEPPGHHACMLYAAIVCPYLARPTARRGNDATVPEAEFRRGEAHGSLDGMTGAVVAFDTYEFEVGETVQFRFSGLREFLPYALGEEHFQALRDAIAAQPAAGEPCPPWLLDDETSAERRAARYA